MKKLQKAISIIAIIALLFTSGVYCAYAYEVHSDDSITGEEALDYFNQAVGLVLSKYKFDVTDGALYKSALRYILENNPELLDEAFTGMFENLDDYSTYYTEEQLKSFIDNMSGEFCGIGVLVMTVDNGLFVSNVYDNSPAKEAGLLPGDIIIRVGETSLAGMDISIAQSYILGPENTFVRLTVQRNGAEFEINPPRRKVVIDSGIYQSLKNDTIGYILLSEFNEHAVDFVQKALTDFDLKGIKNIIFDVRNNPGGSLAELVDMCTLFIPAGPAIHLEFKNPLKDYTLYSENTEVKYNLIVLTNEKSASASEAFAAAVQDTGVGIVVGQTTFGKGTMQNLTNFTIGGGIKLTEAEYLSPNKRTINGIGVIPDFEVTDMVTTYEKSDFEKITYERKLKIGDTGRDVLAVEQRLSYLGLLDAVADEVYDEATLNAVISFQNITQLYQYGVMDITTQLKLDDYLRGFEIVNDDTLEKAIDIFTNDNWQEYKTDHTVEK